MIEISQPNNHNHFTGKKSRFQTPKRKKKNKQVKIHVNKYEKCKAGDGQAGKGIAGGIEARFQENS